MIDSDLIFNKEILIYNELSEFIIQKGDKLFSLTKSKNLISRPKLSAIKISNNQYESQTVPLKNPWYCKHFKRLEY